MELIYSARSKEQKNTDYIKVCMHGLDVSTETIDGNGSIMNPYNVTVKICNTNSYIWSGVIHIELPFDKSDPYFFLPAFMYGKNRGECPQNVPNEFPRLREQMNRPSSPYWMIRSDRLSHPVALAYDNGKIYGLSSSPYFVKVNGQKKQWKPEINDEFYQYSGFTCSLTKGTVGYTLGYENAPWMFVQSHTVKNREDMNSNCFELSPGESIEVNLALYEFTAKSKLEVNDVIEQTYYKYHQSPRKIGNVKNTIADLSKAVFEDAWLEEDMNYSGQVFDENEDGSYRYNKIMSISWTNGLAVATPILMAALRMKDESMRRQAISCISNIVNNSINPDTGLPYDAYDNGKWSVNGWWFDGMHTPGHSSYLVGQAMYYIIKAYDYENKLNNTIHDDWLIFTKNILLKIEKTKNTDFEYPYIFSEKTGAGIEYDALSGAWCMAAMAYYCFISSEHSYVDELLKSEKHYYNSFVRNMECYGAPLDTDKAIDSEGIIAYIKAVKYLHAITGERYLLQHMRDAICYEISFKFCYNSPIKVPPLSRIGWSSCGGSVTSVANPHIHPMSSNLVDELYYYVKNTGDSYINDRLNDTVLWGCQTYNTYNNEYDYGKKGWMSERFCHSEGLLTQEYKDGTAASTWFCLMPWASGSIIDGLAGDYWDSIMDKKQ